MMQGLDGTLSLADERKMLLHFGNCPTCAATWKTMQEASLFLPEMVVEPDESFVSTLMNKLCDAPGKKCENAMSGFIVTAFFMLLSGAYGLGYQVFLMNRQEVLRFLTVTSQTVVAFVKGIFHVLQFVFGRNPEAWLAMGMLLLMVVLLTGALAAVRTIQADHTPMQGPLEFNEDELRERVL